MIIENNTKPKLIAIVGGSGSGKTWLAERLRLSLGPLAARLSLDDFYKDRGHLSFARRAKINYDHPSAIDWSLAEMVLRDCQNGCTTQLPRYSFATHTRLRQSETWMPTPLILVDGLWLLSKGPVNALFDLRIYLECPAQLRLERRVARDITERGRTPDSVREQFWKMVSPMHTRHVAPQIEQADMVLDQPSNESDLRKLTEAIRQLVPNPNSTPTRLPSQSAPLAPMPALVAISAGRSGGSLRMGLRNSMR